MQCSHAIWLVRVPHLNLHALETVRGLCSILRTGSSQSEASMRLVPTHSEGWVGCCQDQALLSVHPGGYVKHAT